MADGNAARGLSRAGFLCGAAFAISDVYQGTWHGADLGRDLLWTSVFAGTALALQALAGWLGLRLLLASRLPAEIERGNVAAGLAAGAHWTATGLVVGSCFMGDEWKDLFVSTAFFALAQVSLHLVTGAFRWLTRYADDQEILGENVAAALSYGGAKIAVAILVAHAASGDFVGWGGSLQAYAVALLAALVLYPVRQVVVQTVILGEGFAWRGGGLDRRVAQERDVGASAVEAVSYLAAAFLWAGMS